MNLVVVLTAALVVYSSIHHGAVGRDAIYFKCPYEIQVQGHMDGKLNVEQLEQDFKHFLEQEKEKLTNDTLNACLSMLGKETKNWTVYTANTNE
jgi:hypothetical protein